MELYKKYPKLCTIWCCIEITLYAGQLFGWSSLLFILKEEGFYSNLCDPVDIDHGVTASINLNDDRYKYVTEEYRHFKDIKDLEDVTTSKYDNVYSSLNKSITKRDGNVKVRTLSTSVGRKHTLDIIQSKTGHAQFEYPYGYKQERPNEYVDRDVTTSRMTSQVFKECTIPDSKLNLWFSVAVCFSYIMCAVLGPLMQKIGMRLFRLFFIVIYVIGALCLGFATPVSPWLICPGLCCVGVAGMALYSTNIQVSFLFPNVQSTITSIFVGLYDVSTVVTQLVKLLYESGVSRRYSYIALAIIHVLVIGTSTFCFLPSISIEPKALRVKAKEKEKKKIHTEHESFITNTEVDGRTLLRNLCYGQYVLHVYWMCVQAVRFVTFLGFLNVWLRSKFNDNQEKESYYLSVFSYITIGTGITAVTAGMLHDCQRREYTRGGDYRRKRMPIMAPLVVTTLLSILTTCLTLVENEHVLYLTFITFTIYRSYLFSFEVTFINDVFPLVHFTVLFGVLHSSAGLAGMLQYPLFEWYDSYDLGPTHVTIFLVCLELSSLIHPLYVWYRCRRHKGGKDSFYLNQEIKV